MRLFSFPVKYVKYFFPYHMKHEKGLKIFEVHPKWNATNKQNQWVHNFGITFIYLSMTRARFHLLFNLYKECKYMYTSRLWSPKYTNTSYTQWEDRQFLFLTFTVMHSITIYSQYCISVGSYFYSHLFNSRCKINIFIYFWVKRLRTILVFVVKH